MTADPRLCAPAVRLRGGARDDQRDVRTDKQGTAPAGTAWDGTGKAGHPHCNGGESHTDQVFQRHAEVGRSV